MISIEMVSSEEPKSKVGDTSLTEEVSEAKKVVLKPVPLKSVEQPVFKRKTTF
jgi:hypothetical protein